MSNIYNSMTELQTINYLFQKNSLDLIFSNDITSDYFTTYKSHYEFINSFYKQYNQMPSKETFQGKFADNFEWINVTDPPEYLIKKLKEAKLFRDVIVSYKDLGELIKSEKTDEAIDKMYQISNTFLSKRPSPCVDLIDNVKQRYDDYIERATNPSKAFVTTGLKELDDIIGGWDMLNETAVLCARTGLGKSWWLVYFALQAAITGLNVGYYSGEMESELIGYRLDTFLGNIANGSLTHGNMNIKEQYEKYANDIKSKVKGHIYCVTPDMLGGSVTVSKLKTFIEKHNIQMMCIDQLSLVDDERHAKTPREQYINISKDLRVLQRLKKIPILTAVQLNREDTTESGPSTRNIAESDRIGQDATTVIFIERRQENVVFTIGKARNARTGDKLTYAWNINLGTIQYIPTENDANSGRGAELIEQQYNDTRSDNIF